ncbi:uncharacterized protein LOC132870679 isoform X2 [Neoarius graeffei]|uniref:uncharacterized protein LOC132870679 isoform X2 n=1 Tax=Neoarius graeffei TaxID=443677 RepID=UPI00298D1FE5|nr:uncharacterized protein LOC132870679 isoform X2 [Neoarius graeffei]
MSRVLVMLNLTKVRLEYYLWIFVVQFLAWRMLVKVKCREKQRYVKITESDGTYDYQQFHQAVIEKFGLPHFTNIVYKDSSGTELDADIFSELLEKGKELITAVVNDDSEDISSEASCSDASTVILDEIPSKISRQDQTEREVAKNMVNQVLLRKPGGGGGEVFQEYHKTKSLTSATRRLLVNILVADMVEVHGWIPSQAIKVKYAQGIVALFPYLEDPLSKHGYEHFYDAASGSGYISWRLKTVQRSLADHSRSPVAVGESSGGPKATRLLATTIQQLTGQECEEAMSMMNHSSDEAVVREKMKATFEHRQKLVHDPDTSMDVLDIFPRFLDIPGLIEQDFLALFGEETSGKFLAKWPTFFRPHIIEDAKGLVSTAHVEDLLCSAQGDGDRGWDSDIASLCLLLHLIPPTSKGHKKAAKVSALQAEDYLVKYMQIGTSMQIFLSRLEPSQPFMLCIGEQKNKIHKFYIIIDSQAVPCRAQTSVAAFDELFKAHFVFGTSYCEALDGFYSFIQTAVYNIDVGKTKEKPRVRELRARYLNVKK